jgi:hypothetical protein
MSDEQRHAFTDDTRGKAAPQTEPQSRVTNVLLFRPGERFRSLPDSPPASRSEARPGASSTR